MPHVLLDAEVRRLEQLRQQDDLGALARGLAHRGFRLRHVGVDVPAAGELRGRDRDRPGCAIEVFGFHRRGRYRDGPQGG